MSFLAQSDYFKPGLYEGDENGKIRQSHSYL